MIKQKSDVQVIYLVDTLFATNDMVYIRNLFSEADKICDIVDMHYNDTLISKNKEKFLTLNKAIERIIMHRVRGNSKLIEQIRPEVQRIKSGLDWRFDHVL